MGSILKPIRSMSIFLNLQVPQDAECGTQGCTGRRHKSCRKCEGLVVSQPQWPELGSTIHFFLAEGSSTSSLNTSHQRTEMAGVAKPWLNGIDVENEINLINWIIKKTSTDTKTFAFVNAILQDQWVPYTLSWTMLKNIKVIMNDFNHPKKRIHVPILFIFEPLLKEQDSQLPHEPNILFGGCP